MLKKSAWKTSATGNVGERYNNTRVSACRTSPRGVVRRIALCKITYLCLFLYFLSLTLSLDFSFNSLTHSLVRTFVRSFICSLSCLYCYTTTHSLFFSRSFSVTLSLSFPSFFLIHWFVCCFSFEVTEKHMELPLPVFTRRCFPLPRGNDDNRRDGWMIDRRSFTLSLSISLFFLSPPNPCNFPSLSFIP